MNNFFCTPVPSGRISQNGRLELRLAGRQPSQVIVSVLRDGCELRRCGPYAIDGQCNVNKIYPDMSGILGPVELRVDFVDASGCILDSQNFVYEIVASEVHSTCLLDGCWVSIYHWSDSEARYFNPGLKKMTDQDWKQHVYSMHKIGITSILIQNVFDSVHYAYQHNMTADSYDGRAFYPSKVYPDRMPLAADDPIEAILAAADECNMAVFPGVGQYAWFDYSPQSLIWHKRVAKELFERYGHHRSFYGWYISEEIMGDLYYTYDPVPNEKYLDIIRFFEEFQKFAHELAPTKPVAMAPSNQGMHRYREQWLQILKHIDILIPFAFARTENNVCEIAQLCRDADTHFWVDMEIFANPFDNGLVPKTGKELLREIHCYDMLEQVYGYQYTGLLNEPGHRMDLGDERTEILYREYEKYEKQIRVRR